jgi:hypothetical protein
VRGLVWVVGLAVVLIGLVVKDMAKEEARPRVERLPHAILRLAVRRLPQDGRPGDLCPRGCPRTPVHSYQRRDAEHLRSPSCLHSHVVHRSARSLGVKGAQVQILSSRRSFRR